MSAKELEVDIFHGMNVRWTVDTKSGNTMSSEFRFKSGVWKLRYYKYETDYFLALIKCSGVFPNPFHVAVHVESSVKGRIVSVLPQERRFTDPFWKKDEGYDIWEKREEEILRAVPEFRMHGILKLIVVPNLKMELGEDISGFTLCKSVNANKVPCLESLSEDLSKLLDHQGHANHDVEFQCGGHSIKAHQAVVSARSHVIASMLTSDTVEGRTKAVKIPDMKLKIFKQFLAYLYTGSLEELSFETAFDLYEAGDQYAVHGLAKRCSKFLIENLSVDNACRLLVVADAHGDNKFKEAVVSFMLEHKVQLSDCWQNFCSNHPMLALLVLNQFCQKVSQ